MDSKRQINQLEIEAPEDHNFEDVVLQDSEGQISCQIKDINSITLSEIKVNSDCILINNKQHRLSQGRNILFIKKIDFEPNCEILGFKAYHLASNVYIISLSREEALSETESYYPQSPTRVSQMQAFFSRCLDKRIFLISRIQLPRVSLFCTELDVPSFDLNVDWIELSNRLIIEGKPGSGKSHLVGSIVRKFPESVIYRFWISSQDSQYRVRLQFSDFLCDLSMKIFSDYTIRTEEEIIEKLAANNNVLLIDGLDHVRNYNPVDLEKYLGFFELASQKVRIILITRPIGVLPDWPRKQIHNWDERFSTEFLDRVFDIKDYKVCQEIFRKTNGYPLLLRYYAEHFRQKGVVPSETLGEDIDTYYSNLFDSLQSRSCLAVFLTNRSYFTFSEIEQILGSDLNKILMEIVESLPYLFEIRLNRISLFHDSFDTFIKKRGVDFEKWRDTVNDIVFQSLANLEREYFSRMKAFDLDRLKVLELAKKYASIETFEKTIKDNIDYEGLQTHYQQIHEIICQELPGEFDVYQYYDLVLILNMLARDHVSTLHNFMYTYCRSLIFHGYTVEDVTSTGYLFSMFFFIETGDSSLIRHKVGSDHYSLDRFEEDFLNDIESEQEMFMYDKKVINLTRPLRETFAGKNEYDILEILQYLLLTTYSNGTQSDELIALNDFLIMYLQGDTKRATTAIVETFSNFGLREQNVSFMLGKVEASINERGINLEKDRYCGISLQDFILSQNSKGSFYLWIEVLNYIRLHLHKGIPIDIGSISLFWVFYAQRKDYTALGVVNALLAFESRMLIGVLESIRVIARFQSLSEKGIRHILGEYLEKSPPQIIEIVENFFPVEELEVIWFHLPSLHVSNFTYETFRCGMRQLLRNGHYDKTLELDDFESVLDSSWGDHCSEVIAALGYSVKVAEGHVVPKLLTDHKIEIKEIIAENPAGAQPVSEQRYQEGTLDQSDIPFIIERALSPEEVAKTVDGWYHALSDISLYSHYSKEQLRADLLKVLHGAIGAKIRSIDHFGSLFEMIGNVPALMIAIDHPVDFHHLFFSFRVFLRMSLGIEGGKI